VKNRIGAFSAVCLLAVSRVTASLFYSPVKTGQSTSADLGGAVLFFFAALLLCVPPILLCNRVKGTVLSAESFKGKAGHRAVLIAAALFFMCVAAVTTARFDLFVTSDVFPESVGWMFSGLMVIFAGFAALRGAEGIGRAASAGAVLVTLCIAVVLIFGFGSADFTAIIHPLWYGWERVFGAAADMLSDTAELALLPFLAIRTGSRGKTAVRAIVWWSVLNFVIMLTNVLIGGGVVTGDRYPYYVSSAASYTASGITMETAATGIWFVGVFFRASLFICAAVDCVAAAVPSFRRNAVVWCVALAVGAVSGTLAVTRSGSDFLSERLPALIAVLAFTLALPLLTLCLTKKKKEPSE